MPKLLPANYPNKAVPSSADILPLVDVADANEVKTATFGSLPISIATQTALDLKQNNLVSTVNIKTVNGLSVLGAGNIVVTAGSDVLVNTIPGTPAVGSLYRNANTLRYRDSANTERIVLNATDNLANLASLPNARTNLGLGGLTGFKTYTVGTTADCDYIYNGTNIAIAINAAITAAPSTGAIIKIQAGTYDITSSILLKNKANLQLIGAGMEHTNIVGASLTTAFIDAYNTTYRFKFLISNLTLDNTTPAVGSRGLYLGLLSDSSFRDISIKNFEQAISLNDGMFYNRFDNIKFEDNKSNAVFTAGAIDKPNSNSFICCKFLANPVAINGALGMHEPVTITNGNQNTFYSCQFENFTRGIYINDIGNAFIANRIESNDVTASVNYVTITANGENNQFMSNYYSGNDFVDFPTSVVNIGQGNIFFEGNTFKGQVFSFERNILTAGPVGVFKRTGSGNNQAVLTAEDTYTPSGTPISYLAKAVRAAGKYLSGTLNAVENFYVTAQGLGYFGNGLDVNSRNIINVLNPTLAQHASTKNYTDNPFSWTPANYNYVSWNYDPSSISNQTVITAGTLQVVKLRIPRATTISNLIINLGTVGATLTNSFVALYQNGNLLAQSTDQSSNWTSTGNKVCAITPQDVVAGTIDIAIWVGTAGTAPGIARGGSQAGANGALTGTNLRWSTADTGITTTAPATLGSRTTSNNTFWAAVS